MECQRHNLGELDGRIERGKSDLYETRAWPRSADAAGGSRRQGLDHLEVRDGFGVLALTELFVGDLHPRPE